MRRLMAKAQINDIISACRPEVRGLKLFDNRPSVGSLSDTDKLPTDEMHRFLMNSVNISQSPITGCKKFPGDFLQPRSENIHFEDSIYDLLVKYYKDTYVDSTFRKPFTEELLNSAIVINKANRFGRCRIGAKIFGSAASPRYIKSSFILAKFISRNGKSVDKIGRAHV